MSDYYFLMHNKIAVPCDAETCTSQVFLMKKYKCKHLKLSKIGKYEISTVWLGINHAWSDAEEPKIFETMVFNKEETGYSELYCDRYSTWGDAMEGHERAKQWVIDGCKDGDDLETME